MPSSTFSLNSSTTEFLNTKTRYWESVKLEWAILEIVQSRNEIIPGFFRLIQDINCSSVILIPYHLYPSMIFWLVVMFVSTVLWISTEESAMFINGTVAFWNTAFWITAVLLDSIIRNLDMPCDISVIFEILTEFITKSDCRIVKALLLSSTWWIDTSEISIVPWKEYPMPICLKI